MSLSAEAKESQVADTQWIGWALASGSLLSTSLVTPISRLIIVAGIHPSFLLLIRLLMAVVLLFSTFALIAPSQLRIDRKGLLLIGGIGLLGGVEICSFFWSLAWLDASMAAMLKTTQPLAVLLLLRLRGEPLTMRHMVRLLLAIGGIYLLLGPGGQVAPFGVLLVGVSLILYALQIVFIQWYLHMYNSNTVTIYMLSVMMLVVAGWWQTQAIPWPDPDLEIWLLIALLAVVSTYFARLALYAAVPRIGSGQISLLWPLQMFLSVLLSVLLLQERLTLIQWLGGCLILASALLVIERFQLERLNNRVYRK